MSSHSAQPQTEMNVKKLLLLIWLLQTTFTKCIIPILNSFSPLAKKMQYPAAYSVTVLQGNKVCTKIN